MTTPRRTAERPDGVTFLLNEIMRRLDKIEAASAAFAHLPHIESDLDRVSKAQADVEARHNLLATKVTAMESQLNVVRWIFGIAMVPVVGMILTLMVTTLDLKSSDHAYAVPSGYELVKRNPQ